MNVEKVTNETMVQNDKTVYLKTIRIILFVFIATIVTGCGLLELEMMESRKVKQDVLKLCGMSDKYSPNDVTVLDWTLNSEAIGDAYIGYIVTYEIGRGYYALVSLIEFDNTSRYDLELVYRGRSLTELNEYIE